MDYTSDILWVICEVKWLIMRDAFKKTVLCRLEMMIIYIILQLYL